MDDNLERRKCIKCGYYFTIAKTINQEKCYVCNEDVEIKDCRT